MQNLLWNPVKADFSNVNQAMANAHKASTEAGALMGSVLDRLRKQELDKQALAHQQFAEDLQQQQLNIAQDKLAEQILQDKKINEFNKLKLQQQEILKEKELKNQKKYQDALGHYYEKIANTAKAKFGWLVKQAEDKEKQTKLEQYNITPVTTNFLKANSDKLDPKQKSKILMLGRKLDMLNETYRKQHPDIPGLVDSNTAQALFYTLTDNTGWFTRHILGSSDKTLSDMSSTKEFFKTYGINLTDSQASSLKKRISDVINTFKPKTSPNKPSPDSESQTKFNIPKNIQNITTP